jgi:triacylglycerol lipase
MSGPARSVRRRARFIAFAIVLLAPIPASGRSVDEGPPLSISTADAEAAIGFPADVHGRPVLLIHGTDSSTRESWTTNYVPALTAAGYSVFTIELPRRAVVDIQISTEYVVRAVRRIHELSERPIALVGHSQGGLEARWALRWWPDTRAMVDDAVSLATPHHGTFVAGLDCVVPCNPAVWQMKTKARFIAALNEGDETPGPSAYTSVFSADDELVQPQLPRSTSALDGASNVMIQDVCPGRPVHHVAMLHDPVAFALVLDALEHPGPADPARVGLPVCARLTIPGVGLRAALDPEVLYWAGFTRASQGLESDEEPALRDYARGA